jgi:2-hydroxy-6-oxonona-2,4-dienedioate hydrolase
VTIWTELAGLDFEVSMVDAGGVPTRSLRAGRGEPLVFLHGTSGHLEAFTRNLVPHAAHYACHAIDMLGHGYTGKPDYRYEIPRYVEHLVGGWVAGSLAIEAPERVASLQLIAAGGTVANPAVMARIKDSTTRAVTTDDVELTRQRLRLLMHDPANATEELVAVRHRIYHQPDFVANLPNLLCLQEPEIRGRNLLTSERLARISAPTMVVWGRQNPFGEVPEAQRMAATIPGARLELLAECGHWPQHEQHERYNALSLEFLAKYSAV